MKLSIVIAAYNEESNVIPLLNRIVIALQGSDYEIIYVDDGSKDKTAMSVKSFGHPRVKLIELRRNYGQSLALRAGIDAAGQKGSVCCRHLGCGQASVRGSVPRRF